MKKDTKNNQAEKQIIHPKISSLIEQRRAAFAKETTFSETGLPIVVISSKRAVQCPNTLCNRQAPPGTNPIPESTFTCLCSVSFLMRAYDTNERPAQVIRIDTRQVASVPYRS